MCSCPGEQPDRTRYAPILGDVITDGDQAHALIVGIV
jgi:hypothetical protein